MAKQRVHGGLRSFDPTAVPVDHRSSLVSHKGKSHRLLSFRPAIELDIQRARKNCWKYIPNTEARQCGDRNKKQISNIKPNPSSTSHLSFSDTTSRLTPQTPHDLSTPTSKCKISTLYGSVSNNAGLPESGERTRGGRQLPLDCREMEILSSCWRLLARDFPPPETHMSRRQSAWQGQASARDTPHLTMHPLGSSFNWSASLSPLNADRIRPRGTSTCSGW